MRTDKKKEQEAERQCKEQEAEGQRLSCKRSYKNIEMERAWPSPSSVSGRGYGLYPKVSPVYRILNLAVGHDDALR